MKTACTTVVLFAMIALATPVLADDPDVEIHPTPSEGRSDATEVIIKTPLQQAIADIQLVAVEQVRVLQNQILTLVPGSAEAREAELQIRTTKQNAEVSILQAIQADALDRGDRKTMAEAELALDHILHPENYPTETFPSNRPAPEGN